MSLSATLKQESSKEIGPTSATLLSLLAALYGKKVAVLFCCFFVDSVMESEGLANFDTFQYANVAWTDVSAYVAGFNCMEIASVEQ